MTGISHCNNKKCPHKETCRRVTEPATESTVFVSFKLEKDGSCVFYLKEITERGTA